MLSNSIKYRSTIRRVTRIQAQYLLSIKKRDRTFYIVRVRNKKKYRNRYRDTINRNKLRSYLSETPNVITENIVLHNLGSSVLTAKKKSY